MQYTFINHELIFISNDKMTAFCLIINKLRSHLSFVTFTMYSYSGENTAYQVSHFLSIATPELSRKNEAKNTKKMTTSSNDSHHFTLPFFI